MKEHEQAVLQAIANGPEYVSWYKIEQRLSVMALKQRAYLPDTLRLLCERGLIEESSADSGTYRLTDSGRAALKSAG